MEADARDRIEALYDALNRRAVEEMVALCHPEVEIDLVTRRLAGRPEPYRGHEGIRRYMSDVERLWDELLVTPRRIGGRGADIVVWGRVYARSRTLGMRDIPAVWVWEQRDSLFIRGTISDDLSALPGGEAPSPLI